MSIERNKVIARRLIDAINQQDLQTLDAVLSPKIAGEVREWVPWIYDTFGLEHCMTITGLTAEEDRVVVRLLTNGGHIGTWHDIPPTGKQWTNTGVYFLTIEDGRVIALDGLFDELGHVIQLGGTIRPPGTDRLGG